LSDADIQRIAAVYAVYKRAGKPEGQPGFYKVASLDDVRGHDYKLTPGIYVGTQANGEDDEAFEDVMPRMIDELRALFAESERLQGLILDDLKRFGHVE
jgi:type I restriction enzyme M protein